MGTMKTILCILACVGLCIIFARWESWRRDQKIEKVFAGREAMNPQEFYEQYFKSYGVPFQIAESVMAILEEQLSADLSRLRGKDDFTRELRFLWTFDSMASVEVVLALEKKFNIEIEDAETDRIRTVSDIVLLVHSKILEKSEAAPAA
jgi:acyl carrier protein